MALVSCKFAHLSIPRTGSTWMRRALEGLMIEKGMRVLPGGATHTFERVPGVPNITVVRNPLNWLPSVYRYTYRQGLDKPDGPPGPARIFGSTNSNSFRHFIECYTTEFPGAVTWVYEQYTKNADFVGKTASVAEDACRFLESIGMDFDRESIVSQSPVNKSQYQPFLECRWDTDLVRRVLKAEAGLFNQYEFSREPA